MRFGLFFELEYPRPWEPGGEQRLFHEALDQAELADRLGYDSAWVVEHHFLEEYSHSSAPEVFLAAVSQRTSRLRLGHGIVLTLPQYNPPARVAERIATLDILSNGRVEFGMGESNSRMELEGFGIDVAAKREAWLEVSEQIANMLAMEPYPGFEGKHFSMPARNVVPKPVQRPHPPLWVACSNRDTIRLAARLGLGALAFTFLEVAEARKWVDEYYRVFREECVPLGHAVNPRVQLVTGFGVHRDAEEARRRFLDGIQFFQFGLNHYYRAGRHRPGRTNLWEMYESSPEEVAKYRTDPVLGKNVAPSLGAIGDVEQVRARIREFAGIPGLDSLVLIQQGGKNRHEEICESMELFASEIMPEFQEGNEEREAAKIAELVPYIEKAFERKRLNPAPLADEEIPEFETINYAKWLKRESADNITLGSRH